ncbi:unnamed protein product, partial [Phaeothamnion confervicola]
MGSYASSDDDAGADSGSRNEHAACLYSELVIRWVLDVETWELTLAQWDFLIASLPAEDGVRVNRYLREPDRRLALGSRLLQRALVARVFDIPFGAVEIARTREGKPYATGQRAKLARAADAGLLEHWNFNVSHHGRYAVIVAEPLCVCGVDLVRVTERRENLLR